MVTLEPTNANRFALEVINVDGDHLYTEDDQWFASAGEAFATAPGIECCKGVKAYTDHLDGTVTYFRVLEWA